MVELFISYIHTKRWLERKIVKIEREEKIEEKGRELGEVKRKVKLGFKRGVNI